MHVLAAWVALLAFVWPAMAFAAPKACTCKNLESIQQELENAVYLADYQAKLAKKVGEAEEAQRQLKKNDPHHPSARRSVEKVSEMEWAKLRDKIALPHPSVTGYTGPDSVGLEVGTCNNRAEDLKALENGASCKEIGTITLKHEEEHRTLCKQLGKTAYWKRLYSEIAAEEAERYKTQAKELRALLKKVLDGSTIKVSEETNLTVSASGLETSYRISLPAFKVSGKSSPGKDDWKLAGTGTRSISVTSVKLPGLTCAPPAGKHTDKTTGTLTLDGLTMSFDEVSQSQGGSFSTTCKAPGKGQGFGYSVAPPGGAGGGEAFADADVKSKTEIKTDVTKSPWGKAIAQTGVALSGTTTIKVEITCQ